jgi:chromosome segregation ATPase
VLLDEERAAKKHYEQQYAELRRRMRDKKAEHVEVLHERDSIRELLKDERLRCESMRSSLRSVEQEFIGVRGELADLQSRHNDECLELDRTLRQRELTEVQLTRERDTAQNALHKEQAAREGIQNLLDQRCRDIEGLTAELENTRADGGHRVMELKQRLHACEATTAQLKRDNAALQSQISAEATGRQSAEHAYREMLGENQQMSREIEKADALLEERLYLAKKLNESETRMRDLLTKNDLLLRELGELAANAGSYGKESIIDRILQLQQQTAEDNSAIDKSCRRSA